jgi:probable addiction module antidote protein
MKTPETVTPFDPADFVRTPEEAALFLSDALDSGDPRVVAAALGVVARARGASQIAQAAGVSRASLYSGLSDAGNPTLGLMMSVLRELGLELRVSARAPVEAAE